ncbi:uncharacterized protein LOC100372089 [Saccoglossus kowalevskii]|uniref:COPII coat assembly protein SEC16-like n=1 Tax=Saccoglossus kowalevskii TaxID=10224 RepID=A0ABM0GWN6_SACKO|nr:PREDICTED: COPII coat assembly protein SEC16-like [Saccoglossus kowalevskii]
MGAGDRGRRGHRHHRAHRNRHRAHHAAAHRRRRHHHHHRRANRLGFIHRPGHVVAGSGASNGGDQGGVSVSNVSCRMCALIMIISGAMMCLPGAVFTGLSLFGTGIGPVFLGLGFVLLISGIALCYFTVARGKRQPNVAYVGEQPVQPVEVGIVQQPTVHAGVSPNQPPGTYPPQPYLSQPTVQTGFTPNQPPGTYPPQPYLSQPTVQAGVSPNQPPGTYPPQSYLSQPTVQAGITPNETHGAYLPQPYPAHVVYSPNPPPTGVYQGNYPGYPVTGASMQLPDSSASLEGHGQSYNTQYGGFDGESASETQVAAEAPPPSYDEVVKR